METAERIRIGDLEDLEFRAELEDGQLALAGPLDDQPAIDGIPVGIYVMEKDGTLVRCNEAAVTAWGRRPQLNASEKYCGAFRLRYPSGDVMPHEHAPPSVVINNGGTVRNADVICEQPDGTRLLALVNVFPIRNADDEVVGALNIFRHNTTKTVPGLTPAEEVSAAAGY